MKHWILGAILASATLCSASGKPNVLFLISDDLGAQARGCCGNTDVETPHIDPLTARGIRFTRAYCQGPEWMAKGRKEHLRNEKPNLDRDQHYKLGYGGAFYVARVNTHLVRTGHRAYL